MRCLTYSRPQKRQPILRQKALNYRKTSKNKKKLTRSAIKIRFNDSLMQTFENFQSSNYNEELKEEPKKLGDKESFGSLSLQSLRDLRVDEPVEKYSKSADDFIDFSSADDRLIKDGLGVKTISRDRPKERKKTSLEEVKGEEFAPRCKRRPLTKTIKNTYSNLDEAFDDEPNISQEHNSTKLDTIFGRGGCKKTTLLDFKTKKNQKIICQISSSNRLNEMVSKTFFNEDNMLQSKEIRKKKILDNKISPNSKSKLTILKNELYDYDFDKIYNFKSYFSQGNFANIEKKLRKSISPMRPSASSNRSSLWSRKKHLNGRIKADFKL